MREPLKPNWIQIAVNRKRLLYARSGRLSPGPRNSIATVNASAVAASVKCSRVVVCIRVNSMLREVIAVTFATMHAIAGIAQLAEQLLRKQLVGGSSPLSGTNVVYGYP